MRNVIAFIEEWDQVGGVLLMGYEMYRSIALYSRNKKNKGKGKRGNRYFDEDGEVFPRKNLFNLYLYRQAYSSGYPTQ